MKKYFSVVLITLSIVSCKPPQPANDPSTVVTAVPKKPEPVKITYTLIETLPHDTTCFTEGLLMYEGKLFESSGAPDNLPRTRSSFGIVNLKNGKLDVKGELDRKTYFGEGIAILNNKLYQLTYQNQVGFIYDAKTFNSAGQFSFKNKEGWGLTTDGTSLIMSDGTSDLTFLDPANQNVVKTLNVNTINYDLPDQLNELEYINGFIYANVWRTNTIIKIDPATGDISGIMDLTQLAATARSKYKNSLEMNGIAFDPATKKMLITGKMWPEIYKIEIAF
ncbi:MAG: glutaminyl-peptide cyclotransferase [Bacteroidetes bacterium]|nr:glutaminyl-peptide cyclotransferase [Bacteroidota bacterium]